MVATSAGCSKAKSTKSKKKMEKDANKFSCPMNGSETNSWADIVEMFSEEEEGDKTKKMREEVRGAGLARE